MLPQGPMDVIGKYEAWQRELGERRKAVVESRKQMRVLLVLAVLAFPVGYFGWGFWYGMAGLFLFASFFATGTYIASMYEWDYIRKSDGTRAELARLRSEVAQGRSAEEAARAGDLRPPDPDNWKGARVPRKLLWGMRGRP
jgi:hypothetical protein